MYGFGRADRAVLERLVAGIRRVLGEENGESVVERAGEIVAMFELGLAHVVKSSRERLGIAAAIASKMAEKKLTASHLAALLAMTRQRLEWPGSKLDCHARWQEQVWLPEVRD